jgi:hypothetical protein
MAKLDGTTVVSFQRGATWITQSLGEVLAGSSGDPDPKDEPVNGEDEQNGSVGVDMEDVSESDEEVGSNFNPRYTTSDRRRFRDQEKHRQYRKMLQQGMNKGFRIVSLSCSTLSFPPLVVCELDTFMTNCLSVYRNSLRKVHSRTQTPPK